MPSEYQSIMYYYIAHLFDGLLYQLLRSHPNKDIAPIGMYKFDDNTYGVIISDSTGLYHSLIIKNTFDGLNLYRSYNFTQPNGKTRDLTDQTIITFYSICKK